jgi:hypothetical protein
MRTKFNRFLAATGAAASGLAAAHPGHGERSASHAHAGDVGIWILGLAVGAVALWLLRRR